MISTSLDDTMTTSMTSPTQAAATRPSARVWQKTGRYGAVLMLAALVITMSTLEPATFATKDNLINILNQSALPAIIAIGLTFTLVTGEFDLSIGNTASLGGVVACTLISEGHPIALAILLSVGVGVALGVMNGLVVTVLGVNALVATLGVGTAAVGLNYAIAGGLPVTLDNPDGFVDISLGLFLGIPYPVYVMFGLATLAWFVLNRTVLGQSMQAVGGNPEAAKLSGIRVDLVRVSGYVLCGTLASLTGVLLASRTGSAAATAGDSYLLAAFAAAFFGSAVLRDGQFHIIGTLVGVVTVAVGFNAIALLDLETYWQYLFQGIVLIVGVGVGTLARRRAAA